MSTLSEHVTLTIQQDSVGIARANFGIPLIVSHNAAWAERVRTYGSVADVAVDFVATSPEYLAAAAMFAQSPHVETLKIGRASLKPTMAYEIEAQVATALTEYAIEVDGQGVTATSASHTTDSSTSIPEIHSALVTALNAVTGKNYTATFAALVYADDTFTAAASDICTNVAHGLLTGDGPFQLTTSAADLPLNLLLATDYWIIKLDADTFSFAASLALALAGTAFDIGDAGTGVHTISDTVNTKRPTSAFAVTGTAAGDWFSLEINSPDLLSNEMTHVDPGVATDLDAIALESPDFYAVVTNYNSQAYIAGVAAWVSAYSKIYIFDDPNTDAITTVGGVGGSADALDAQHTLLRANSAGAYHPSPVSMMSAAWVGLMLPLDPGSATWKFKLLTGVPAVTLTATHRVNLRARKANTVETVAGRNITWEGTMADGEFIDIQQGIDWLQDDMTAGVFGAFAGAAKIPFTNEGISMVENQIRASLGRAIAMGILADDPAPEVTVPKASAVSVANKAIRNLTGVRWNATLAGAIHKVTISGVVSV